MRSGEVGTGEAFWCVKTLLSYFSCIRYSNPTLLNKFLHRSSSFPRAFCAAASGRAEQQGSRLLYLTSPPSTIALSVCFMQQADVSSTQEPGRYSGGAYQSAHWHLLASGSPPVLSPLSSRSFPRPAIGDAAGVVQQKERPSRFSTAAPRLPVSLVPLHNLLGSLFFFFCSKLLLRARRGLSDSCNPGLQQHTTFLASGWSAVALVSATASHACRLRGPC
jgi:hypothetical protein